MISTPVERILQRFISTIMYKEWQSNSIESLIVKGLFKEIHYQLLYNFSVALYLINERTKCIIHIVAYGKFVVTFARHHS